MRTANRRLNRWPLTTLIAMLVTSALESALLFASAAVQEIPSDRTAYIEQSDNLSIETRFVKRLEQPVDSSPPLHADLSIEFFADQVIGRADVPYRVRCLLIEGDDTTVAYGVYGLWKEKSELQMPLPSSEQSVIWEDLSAAAALSKLLTSVGVSAAETKVIFAERSDNWFRPDLRAILLHRNDDKTKPLVQITIFECLDEITRRNK